MSVEDERRLTVGDRVRFRDSLLPAAGVIVDEFGDEHVSVRWHEVEEPTTHHRSLLERDG